MKLLRCLLCGDIVALGIGKMRKCDCGASKGRYVDERYAEYEGPSQIIGMDSNDLRAARGGLPGGPAKQYPWWIISDSCSTVRKLDKFPSNPMKATKPKESMRVRSSGFVGSDHETPAGKGCLERLLEQEMADFERSFSGDFDTGQPDAWGEDEWGDEP
jgi:hypothetical protein